MLEGGTIGDIGIGDSDGWGAVAAHSVDVWGVEKIGGRGEMIGEGVGGIVAAAHFVGIDCWVASTAVVVGMLVVGVLAVFTK